MGHHLDGNKWNLLPWNPTALCQRCHREMQWTIDFHQANLTGVYPEWLRAHVEAYNGWARNKGAPPTCLDDLAPHPSDLLVVAVSVGPFESHPKCQ